MFAFFRRSKKIIVTDDNLETATAELERFITGKRFHFKLINPSNKLIKDDIFRLIRVLRFPRSSSIFQLVDGPEDVIYPFYQFQLSSAYGLHFNETVMEIGRDKINIIQYNVFGKRIFAEFELIDDSTKKEN